MRTDLTRACPECRTRTFPQERCPSATTPSSTCATRKHKGGCWRRPGTGISLRFEVERWPSGKSSRWSASSVTAIISLRNPHYLITPAMISVVGIQLFIVLHRQYAQRMTTKRIGQDHRNPPSPISGWRRRPATPPRSWPCPRPLCEGRSTCERLAARPSATSPASPSASSALAAPSSSTTPAAPPSTFSSTVPTIPSRSS